MQIVNPLPQRYYTEDPGLGGVIKARAEDFVVDEIPRYDPAGSGEHLFLRIEKRNVSHSELVSRLRRKFGVPERAIGFAGMKDKLAVTRQTVSVHVLDDPADLDLGHERITIQGATRHTNKLRPGHLVGNRFSIRIRGVEPIRVTQVKRQLERIQRSGVPNYFGPQRFGYRRNNHVLGSCLLRADYDAALEEMLGTNGSPFPQYQLRRRQLFDSGRLAEAAELWTPADRTELTVINALRDGRGKRDALRCVGKTTMSFWISALQSAIFNRVLDRRIDDGALTKLVEGDLAWKHDNGAVFLVTADELADPALAQRVETLELSPSGPIWGAGMTEPGDAVGAIERKAMDATGVPQEAFGTLGQKGGRRPMRVGVSNAQVEAGVDQHGGYIQLAFDLRRGAYATVLLREIMKTPEDGMPA